MTLTALKSTSEKTSEVRISAGLVVLSGELLVPDQATGIVLFAHGSGSSRFSPRNQYVARIIREAGVGTLLFDLLTREEEAVDMLTRRLRFDISLLAQRLIDATHWLASADETRHLRPGYFGSSTGGGAALVAAAALGETVGAVVSRGGRPDLAGDALRLVKAPTLLIVGGRDYQVIEMNREALAQLRCEEKLAIVPGATHLFEEPGALEQVALLASDWFVKHLTKELKNRFQKSTIPTISHPRLRGSKSMFTKIFRDRRDAGQFLAEKLSAYANQPDVVVLALPRGGVPVAYEVANRLNAPLDVFVVRKLGVPGHEELAMGAIASGGVRFLNPDVLSHILIHRAIIDRVTEYELSELQRREQLYRGKRLPLGLKGRTVIIVDDGLATGSTMRAAVKALRQKQPKKIVVAVPVGARETCDSFKDEVDTMAVCAITPEPFQAVGLWYQDFSQTTDEEVRDLLARADRTKAAA